MTSHVVMFSGGLGSWAAASRVRERYPSDSIIALFADTLIEDEDLYRFLPEAAASVGAELVRIADGRTPWQVFRDERFLGNSRVDPCSKILKRKLCDAWLTANCDPSDTVVYVGIDWSESHRFERTRERMGSLGWRVEAPLCDPPVSSPRSRLADLSAAGIAPPRLYAIGFEHNNCGGFCVKGGQAAFATLLRQMPERYREHERQEESLRSELGDVAIMRDRSGGQTSPLTMRAFRERVEAGQSYDLFDFGACGCFTPDTTTQEVMPNNDAATRNAVTPGGSPLPGLCDPKTKAAR